MKRFPVTIGLIAVNALVFLVMAGMQRTLAFSDPDDFLALLFTGANFNPLTLGGQPWRIVTSMFLHGNIVHLLVNMLALYNIGVVLEERIGSGRILLIYFITGIAGSLASLSFNLFIVSVGASGAVFGIYGYLLLVDIVENARNRAALNSIVISFVIFLATTYLISLRGNIDNAAHAGGFFTGLALAGLHIVTRSRSVVLLVAMLAAIPFTLRLLPLVQLRYYEIFQQTLQTDVVLNRLKHQNLGDGPFLDSLRRLTHRWDTLQQRIHRLEGVPRGLVNDTATLSSYIALRRQEADYHARWIEYESYVYQDSLEVTYAALAQLPPFEHPLGLHVGTGSDASDTAETSAENVGEQIRVMYDSNWVETENPAIEKYYRIGWRDSLGRWQGNVQDYYREGALQMKGRYTDNLHDGVFLYYSESGKYESVGRYSREDAVGKWEYYYPNGRLHREVIYAGRVFTRTVYDTTGQVQVINGNGRQVTWHPNGVVEEEGTLQNGWRQGLWRGYYRDGKPYFEEYYRDNRLVQGRSLDSQGNRFVYDQTSFYPYPESDMPAYIQYLRSGVRMAGMANQGVVVKLVFTVGQDGSVRDFVVLDKECPSCQALAIQLVKDGVGWRPALLRGQEKIQSQAYLEVEF